MKVGAIVSDGHGEETLGKMSPVFEYDVVIGGVQFRKGERFKENWFNQAVADMLLFELVKRNIYVKQLCPEEYDVPLNKRKQRQNKMYDEMVADGYLPLTISIHANGHGDGSKWTTAQGVETYYKGRDEESKRLATLIQDRMMNVRKEYLPYNQYTDRGVKTANFYVFRNYKGVVVLPEAEFMTHKGTVVLLASKEYQEKVAKAIADAIEEYQGFKIIGDLDSKTGKTV